MNPVIYHNLNVNATSIPLSTFISIWDTTLVSSGGSLDTLVVKLPLISTGTYNFIVDWGDGTNNTIVAWDDVNVSHSYPTEGVYKITITGIINGWQFANTGDRLKLLSILQWGPLQLGDVGDYFWGCENLDLSYVSDVLNLSATTSLYRAFYQCVNITTINNINKWNTSTITTLNRTFDRCINFNDNIGNWDTSNVTIMENVFMSASKFNNGDNVSIGEWNTSKVTTFKNMFGSDSFTGYMIFNQYIGDWDTSQCDDMSFMFFRNPKFNQDIGTKKVTKTGVPYLAWDTKNVTTMASMFSSNGINMPQGNFNNNESSSINNWNTTLVTTMRFMFHSQTKFNQPLGTKQVDFTGGTNYIAWDTQNVTDFAFMFYAHTDQKISGVFNNGGSGKIGNWNTSKATTMLAMFCNQPFFNQNIGTSIVNPGTFSYLAWDTILVNDMSFMFFNSITDGAFDNGGNFSIGFWDTSKVTTMKQMFTGAPFFNQNIGPRTVTGLRITPYTSWDVGLVTHFGYMFYGYPFPRNMSIFNNAGGTPQGGSNSIQNWNTVSAIEMYNMFSNNLTFNRPLSWNTSAVTNMSAMFRNAIGFNRHLGALNVSAVTTFGSNTDLTDQFMAFKTFNNYSYDNYDKTLIEWATRPVLPNKVISFGTAKYSAAAIAARSILTSSPNNWTIIDGGQIIL
jgi:surface protein